MLAGSQILQPPPASHEELCSRLESTLLDISDLAVPARLLKDAEALLADWFAAERSRVERSAAPALYRAIETLSRLTSIRRTLIGLAKALMEPPRPPAAKATPSPSAPVPSSFVVPPSGGPGEDGKLSADETRETNPIAPAPAQIARPIGPIGLPKLSLTAVLSPEPSARSAPTPLDAPLPSPGSAPSPTPQPKRGPLVRSSAEIVSQVRSCPRLATLSKKLLNEHTFRGGMLKTAFKFSSPTPRPGYRPPISPGQALAEMGFTIHTIPPPPDSTADPPNTS